MFVIIFWNLLQAQPHNPDVKDCISNLMEVIKNGVCSFAY